MSDIFLVPNILLMKKYIFNNFSTWGNIWITIDGDPSMRSNVEIVTIDLELDWRYWGEEKRNKKKEKGNEKEKKKKRWKGSRPR